MVSAKAARLTRSYYANPQSEKWYNQEWDTIGKNRPDDYSGI